MMILNMRLEGLPEDVVTGLVQNGIASNKSEAIRLMILHYNEHFDIVPLTKTKRMPIDEEKFFYQKMTASTNQEIWNNEADEKMSQWYIKQTRDGK